MKSFTSLLAELIDAKFPSRRAFARSVDPDRDEGAAAAYLSQVLRQRKAPPIHLLPGWMDALELSPADRRRLLLAAAVARLPEDLHGPMSQLVDDYDRLQAEVIALRRAVGDPDHRRRAAEGELDGYRADS